MADSGRARYAWAVIVLGGSRVDRLSESVTTMPLRAESRIVVTLGAVAGLLPNFEGRRLSIRIPALLALLDTTKPIFDLFIPFSDPNSKPKASRKT